MREALGRMGAKWQEEGQHGHTHWAQSGEPGPCPSGHGRRVGRVGLHSEQFEPKAKGSNLRPPKQRPPLPWGPAPLRRKLVEIRGTEWCSQATTNTLEPEFRGWTPVQIH